MVHGSLSPMQILERGKLTEPPIRQLCPLTLKGSSQSGMWTRGERDSQEVGPREEEQQVSQRLDSEFRIWDNAHGSNVSWILPHSVSILSLPLSGWLLFKQLGKVVSNLHFNEVCHRMVFSRWNSVSLPLPHCLSFFPKKPMLSLELYLWGVGGGI